MSLVERVAAAGNPAVAGVLERDVSLLPPVLPVPVRLAERVCRAESETAREALVNLRLHPVVERFAVAVNVADVAEPLNAELRCGRVVDALERPPRLRVRVGRRIRRIEVGDAVSDVGAL